MSRRRQSHPTPAPRARSGRYIETRARRHKPGPDGPIPVANSTEIAGEIREICSVVDRAMQLELVVAQFFIRLRDAITPEGHPIGAAALGGFVPDLEQYGDGLSLAILRTLAELARGETAARAAEAAMRLDMSGLQPPTRFRALASAEATDAWAISDGGETCLFMECEHADRSRHSIGLFVEGGLAGSVKYIGIADSMWAMAEDDCFHPSAMEEVPVREMAEVLDELMERIDPLTGIARADSDCHRSLIASARAKKVLAT